MSDGPLTIRATPISISQELEPLLERAVEIVIKRIGARFDALEIKSIERQKLLLNRLSELETILIDHEERLKALETTRIQIVRVERERKISKTKRIK